MGTSVDELDLHFVGGFVWLAIITGVPFEVKYRIIPSTIGDNDR
jgi:hypothetical protein